MKRPWRIWVLSKAHHWIALPGMAYATEAAAQAGLAKHYPQGCMTMTGAKVAVGHESSGPPKESACVYKSPQWCNGKDVRMVIPRRIDTSNGWKNIYDGAPRPWCQGCRELNHGGFKYA